MPPTRSMPLPSRCSTGSEWLYPRRTRLRPTTGSCFPVKGDYQDFFRSAGHPNADQKKFERAIANISLPIGEQNIAEAAQQFLQAYWDGYQYGNFAEVLLTFPMINRLVRYILEDQSRNQSGAAADL